MIDLCDDALENFFLSVIFRVLTFRRNLKHAAVKYYDDVKLKPRAAWRWQKVIYTLCATREGFKKPETHSLLKL